MSIYAVNHLCRQTLRDPAFREAMRTDPRAATAGLALTPEEQEALVHGEVGELYRMGANTFLLGYLVRFGLLGLNFDNYRARLRAAANMGDEATGPASSGAS